MKLKNLAANGLGTLQFTFLVGVEQDQRMHIAIAGVEHVGYAQIVLGREVGNAL